MKAGSSMTVKAISRRGTDTSYSYSLKGVTAALNQIASCN
jgi:invasion protein IalB